jgi:prevent-host-death family protein
MHKISATEAKNKFGEVLDNALQSGPISITRKDRPVGVLLAFESYLKLEHRLEELEDLVWGLRAKEAHQEGHLSEAESEALMGDLLNAKD